MNKYYKFLNWHYTRWGGFLVVQVVLIWSLIHRKREISINLYPISKDHPIIFASNHMSFFDPPTIFSALNQVNQLKISPIKFMTSRKYYYSLLFPLLYTTGGFPHKGSGRTGVDGSVFYSKEGYSIFIFPEGKLNRQHVYTHAYPGVSKIISQLDNPRIILVNIFWEQRKKFFSRPKVIIKIRDAHKSLVVTSPEEIMKQIYNL